MATLCLPGGGAAVLTVGCRMFALTVVGMRGGTLRLGGSTEWAVVTLCPDRSSVFQGGRRVNVLQASPEIANCLTE